MLNTVVLQNIVCLSISTKKKMAQGARLYDWPKENERCVQKKTVWIRCLVTLLVQKWHTAPLKSHFLPFEQDTYENISYLHFRSFGWGYFSVIYLNLSSRHFVETLMHDTQRLSHFLHSAQISESSCLSLIKSKKYKHRNICISFYIWRQCFFC